MSITPFSRAIPIKKIRLLVLVLGFGANVQTASATWINGDIRNGFDSKSGKRSLSGDLLNGPILALVGCPNGNTRTCSWVPVQLVRSNNYNREKGNHSFNLHSRLMIQYNFK